jgi:hypothetical protein
MKSTNMGSLDIVNGGLLGRILNPFAATTTCKNGSAKGAFCHGWAENHENSTTNL